MIELINTLGKVFTTNVPVGRGGEQPIWFVVLMGIFLFIGWLGSGLIKERIQLTKKNIEGSLTNNVPLRAQILTASTGILTEAELTREGDSYLLNVSRAKPDRIMIFQDVKFNSLEELAAFLETNTVFRLGDFK